MINIIYELFTTSILRPVDYYTMRGQLQSTWIKDDVGCYATDHFSNCELQSTQNSTQIYIIVLEKGCLKL